jgi:tRNA (guanine37-N1)-methyltransferase
LIDLRIDIITCLPGMFSGFLDESIVKRAREKKIVTINVHNLRDYTNDKHRQVDDYAYGGGAGMVLMIEPIVNCLRKLQQERNYDEIIYLSPDGSLFDQPAANELSMKQNLVLLSGHYKGVDERVRSHFITREISIGDYVLSGGELPAAVVTDALVRLLPGTLNDETSALSDSYQDGLVAPPVYTRPDNFEGLKVPDILLSGHAANIEKWRFERAVERTAERRPWLLRGNDG